MSRIELSIRVTLDSSSKEVISLSINDGPSIPVSESEKSRGARLQSSRNAMFAGQQLPTEHGLLVDSREAAKMLNVSSRTLWSLYNSGAMPKPIRIGRVIRFSYDALREWVDSGCPKG
jgi:excisionase family DNA binding protein